jgi:hypothetical protein
VGLCFALYVKFSICYCCLLFYLITDKDCVALPSIDVRTSTPPKDEVAVVRHPDCNSNARGQVLFDATCRHRWPATLYIDGQHRRSLWSLSPLWLPYPLRQFLQDSCPERLPRLCHARPLRCLRLRHMVPPELPLAERWEPWGHVVPPELPCARRRVLEPR